jgi:hypothetical protein
MVKGTRKQLRANRKKKIASMDGTSGLERRLNYKGEKSRNRKAARQQKRAAKKGLSSPSRKIDMPQEQTLINVPGPSKIRRLTPDSRDLSFGEMFSQERAAQGAGGTFSWRGGSYSTNRADDKKTPTKSSNSALPKVHTQRGNAVVTDTEAKKLTSTSMWDKIPTGPKYKGGGTIKKSKKSYKGGGNIQHD